MPELILMTIALIAATLFIPRVVRRLRGKRVQWIDPSGLRQLLSGPGSAIVIDVRSTQEFRQDRGLPKAYNIPLPELRKRLEEIREHRENTVILVCQTHKRSETAAGHLNKAGFSDLKILRGGIEAWYRAGPERSKEAQI
jgi:rhodanese-related sulfurtransferase